MNRLPAAPGDIHGDQRFIGFLPGDSGKEPRAAQSEYPECRWPGCDGVPAVRRAGEVTRPAARSGHVSGRPYVLLMADVSFRVRGKILLKN
ncbi:hypothetical protein Stube_40850 [Streptomyces tubercidicus]|uniref:Uncharacterized protein n=1 Tax=Streptomyces tubercidicus TaxID=47759 RepID=A0A640UVN1_9ACTN|nr:hypothetical protein Stube_40850 [Streptomyces tubercidicus]